MRAECLKLMLLADADPTLPSGIGFTYFESELKIGTVVSELSIVLITSGLSMCRQQ